jgi:hypothetical protein
MPNEDLKQKLRRAARHLQGDDTSYFYNTPLLNAITMLYRLADEVGRGV